VVRRSAAKREKHEVFFSLASEEGEAAIQPPEPNKEDLRGLFYSIISFI
jgi:hypothetical protein